MLVRISSEFLLSSFSVMLFLFEVFSFIFISLWFYLLSIPHFFWISSTFLTKALSEILYWWLMLVGSSELPFLFTKCGGVLSCLTIMTFVVFWCLLCCVTSWLKEMCGLEAKLSRYTLSHWTSLSSDELLDSKTYATHFIFSQNLFK